MWPFEWNPTDPQSKPGSLKGGAPPATDGLPLPSGALQSLALSPYSRRTSRAPTRQLGSPISNMAPRDLSVGLPLYNNTCPFSLGQPALQLSASCNCCAPLCHAPARHLKPSLAVLSYNSAYQSPPLLFMQASAKWRSSFWRFLCMQGQMALPSS
ncbi:hypothetical protein GOP47_0003291, partial [Adiantum capillus-veneris]